MYQSCQNSKSIASFEPSILQRKTLPWSFSHFWLNRVHPQSWRTSSQSIPPISRSTKALSLEHPYLAASTTSQYTKTNSPHRISIHQIYLTPLAAPSNPSKSSTVPPLYLIVIQNALKVINSAVKRAGESHLSKRNSGTGQREQWTRRSKASSKTRQAPRRAPAWQKSDWGPLSRLWHQR